MAKNRRVSGRQRDLLVLYFLRMPIKKGLKNSFKWLENGEATLADFTKTKQRTLTVVFALCLLAVTWRYISENILDIVLIAVGDALD